MPNKKKTTAFYCSECGYESAKWVGQCPACHAWNTMVEAPVRVIPSAASSFRQGRAGKTGLLPEARPVSLSEIHDEGEVRWSTGYGELDRVLGGGIVKGSMLLVGGDPGIGKSTLLLQVTRNLAESGRRVIYVSGEESLHQIKLRAGRIGKVGEQLKFYCETDLDRITEVLLEEKPELVVIDSIQTMNNSSVDAAPGSISRTGTACCVPRSCAAAASASRWTATAWILTASLMRSS